MTMPRVLDVIAAQKSYEGAMVLSSEAAGCLSTFFCLMNAVNKVYSCVRDCFTFSQKPMMYAAGTFVAAVFDNPVLRTAAYVTYVTRRTLDWSRQLSHLNSSFDRFLGSLCCVYKEPSNNPFETLSDIFFATTKLLEELFYFFFASLDLVDIFNISGTESIRQFFWHAEHIVQEYSSDPRAWVAELQENLPILEAIFPQFTMPLGEPKSLIHQMDQILTPPPEGAVNQFFKFPSRVQFAHHVRSFDSAYRARNPLPLATREGDFNNVNRLDWQRALKV